VVYRDDEEAARARADALAGDLERTQRELEETKAKLAATERERDHLELLRKLEDKPTPAPARARRARSTTNAGTVLVVAGGAVLGMCALVILGYHRGVRHEAAPAATPPPDAPCTLVSVPAGAALFSHDTYLGTTPVTRLWGQWKADAIGGPPEYELRLTGYRTVSVGGCNLGIVDLEPLR
jgi:hypothetical protein